MPRSKPLRVGMIGGGSWASRHLRAYRQSGCDVVGIYNRTRSRSEALARKFGIPSVAPDAGSLLRRDDVDVVSISMPHDMHHHLCLEAIAAGKHVFCEKPLATSFAEAREMWERARAAGVRTGMQYSPRIDPAMIRIRALIAEGYLGDVQHVELNAAAAYAADPDLPMMWRMKRAAAGSGALGDMGTYVIDLSRWLLGEVHAVAGFVRTWVPRRPVVRGNPDFFESIELARVPEARTGETAAVENDDEAVFLATFECSATGQLKASRVHEDLQTKIFGSEGSVVQDVFSGRLMGKRRGERSYTPLDVPPPNPDETIVSAFVRSIRSGSDEGPTFFDGMRNMAVIDAVLRAAEERRWVEVSEVMGF